LIVDELQIAVEVRYNKERNTCGGVEICLDMTTTELGAEYELF